jgi:hypothetical protein
MQHDGSAPAQTMSMAERADALEERMMHELEHIVAKSVLCHLADGKVEMEGGLDLLAANPGKYMLMGADPRLPQMPEKPTLMDYFRCRFASTSHLLQSATHALKAGHSEKVVLACLLHDVGVVSFIRCDHGYWGAQMRLQARALHRGRVRARPEPQVVHDLAPHHAERRVLVRPQCQGQPG